MIRNEIFAFFFAGMKTIQVATTNLVYYLEKHPQYKAQLLREIALPVEKVKDQIVEKLEYETVLNFSYLQ